MRRAPVFLITLAIALPAVSEAQNSIYGVHGIGFLGRPIGTRARATGGGLAVFDPGSALNPAAAAGFRSVAVSASIGTTLRSYTALGASADGLRETRSPFGQLGGWIRGTPVSFSITYHPYAERSYTLTTSDTISIRDDEAVEVSDRISSDGAVADVGGALGIRISSRLSIGAAIHIITGSAEASALRTFTPNTYQSADERAKLGFSALGFSVGAMVALHPRLTIAAALRSDSRLETSVGSALLSRVELPVTASGGVLLVPIPALQWATTVVYQSWSDAASDLAASGVMTKAFDTWAVSSGFELGARGASSRIPLRLGFRYAKLPFSPTDDQPREVDISAGSGVNLTSRANLGFSVERILRKGGGADEKAWYVTVSVTLRP